MDSLKTACRHIAKGAGHEKYTEFHVESNRPIQDILVSQIAELNGVENAFKYSRYCISFRIGSLFEQKDVEKNVLQHVRLYYQTLDTLSQNAT